MSASENNIAGLQTCVLASGSRGNSVYISGGSTGILIDAGLSGKELIRRMNERGISPESIGAILVTHEHTDHVNAAGILCRKLSIPLYINDGTYAAAAEKLGKIKEIRKFESGRDFTFGDLHLHPFTIPHDAEDPVGFTVRHGNSRMGLATDLGTATSVVRQHLSECDLLILEANHDPVMLANGPYPWPLKQRVKGRTGHLSNEASRDLAGEVGHPGLANVIIGHLSDENNCRARAAEVVGQALDPSLTRLTVASQDNPTPLITV